MKARSSRILHIEFWLARRDTIFGQRGTKIIHSQGRLRLVLRMKFSVSPKEREPWVTHPGGRWTTELVRPGAPTCSVGANPSMLVRIRSDVRDELLGCER